MTAQEKQIVVEVLEWLTNEKCEFSIMYGNQDERFASHDKDYTINEILEIFKTHHNSEKKHTYSKSEVIDFLDWYKKISPILDKKYIGKSSKEILEIYKNKL
jgi:hypothetical protein